MSSICIFFSFIFAFPHLHFSMGHTLICLFIFFLFIFHSFFLFFFLVINNVVRIYNLWNGTSHRALHYLWSEDLSKSLVLSNLASCFYLIYQKATRLLLLTWNTYMSAGMLALISKKELELQFANRKKNSNKNNNNSFWFIHIPYHKLQIKIWIIDSKT